MINLMYAGNDYTFNGVLISLLSIIKHCKKPLNVYILTMDLSDINSSWNSFSIKHKEILEKILKQENKESKITIIDVKDLYLKNLSKGKNNKTKYTPYSMIRLLADQIEEIPEKILYLDYDVVANKNIESLYDIDISDYELVGSRDYYGRIFFDIDYINSGVLLMNINKIRETQLFERCLDLIKRKRMLLPDQSALNLLTRKKLIIDDKFNEQHKLKDDTVIRHFSMTLKFFPKFKKQNIKPWQIDKVHDILKIYEFDDIFEKYQKILEKISNSL